jgi:phosphatidylinositol-3-phosphatase
MFAKTKYMRFSRSYILLLTAMALAGGVYGQSLPAPSHIFVVIEENHAYSQVIGSSYAPHINALCADTNAALFTGFYAIEHPSQPNYIDLFSGNNQGVTDDSLPSGYPFTTPNLCAELLAASQTFATYSEDLPYTGYDGITYTTGSADYARKHNPCANWVYTGSGTPPTNQYSSSVNRPFSAFPFATGYGTLPTITFIVPNLDSDMHNGSSPANITPADNWFYRHIDSLRAWALANNSLLILTFDEDDDYHSNNIPVIFYGPMVKGGTYTEHINHYNLLRTMEDIYSLGHAGNAATATDITDCWRAAASTSVQNLAGHYDLKIVPDPANNEVVISCSNRNNAIINISVADVAGHIVGKYAMQADELHITTTGYANGTYIYAAYCNGRSAASGKFIISHN